MKVIEFSLKDLGQESRNGKLVKTNMMSIKEHGRMTILGL